MQKMISSLLVCLIFLFIGACSESNGSSEKNDSAIRSDLDTKPVDDGSDQNTTDNQNTTDSSTDEENDDDTADPETGFSEGPYGTGFGDIAADFTLPTRNGDWNFREKWNGEDVYIFFQYWNGDDYSSQLWKSNIVDLLKKSPENVHYFFISGSSGEEKVNEDLKLIEDTLSLAESMLEEELVKYWKNRIHLVTRGVGQLENWIGKVRDRYFGIDRFQKIRRGGLLQDWSRNAVGLTAAQYEVRYYNFEYEREKILLANENVTTVKGLDGELFEGEWPGNIYFDVEFPSPEEMKSFNRMEIDLRQELPENIKDAEWDRIQHLFLCEKENPEKCTTEVARWITSYARAGRWVTDISPLLPLIKDGGLHRFRLTVTKDQYHNYLNFRLSENSAEKSPFEIVPLYAGNTGFNQNHNRYWHKLGEIGGEDGTSCITEDNEDGTVSIKCDDGTDATASRESGGDLPALHEGAEVPNGLFGEIGDFFLFEGKEATDQAEAVLPAVYRKDERFERIELDVPADAKKVTLVAYVTGHGNGSEKANCAEFCPFESIFTVNGTEFVKDHPNGGTQWGCAEMVDEGVVPNQWGSWPYGRAGWCPGLDVAPWIADVTDVVKDGKLTVRYGALLDGEEYTPEVTNPGGYRAEIFMNSYMVYWR